MKIIENRIKVCRNENGPTISNMFLLSSCGVQVTFQTLKLVSGTCQKVGNVEQHTTEWNQWNNIKHNSVSLPLFHGKIIYPRVFALLVIFVRAVCIATATIRFDVALREKWIYIYSSRSTQRHNIHTFQRHSRKEHGHLTARIIRKTVLFSLTSWKTLKWQNAIAKYGNKLKIFRIVTVDRGIASKSSKL